MSRINTNVSSLVAQNTLGRNNNDLQQALGRLSTGLRINSGADDPAGLIASETLRRDITAVDKAITNSEKAGQLIATADSALGQVSNLLNDIRGLVTESANAGVLSDEQVAAQQLQVDSSLEAIDRIAASTTFQGRKILDGTLGFLLTEGTGFSTAADLQIDQANLGTAGSLGVSVDISAAATRGQITNAEPTTASAQLTFDSQTFTVTSTVASGLDSVTIATEKAAGPEATATIDIDGFSYTITADASQGAAFTDKSIVVATNSDVNHVAESDITFDGSVIRLKADDDTTIDGTTVNVQKEQVFASAAAVTFTATGTLTTTITAVDGGAAQDENAITLVIQEAPGASTSVYDDTLKTLTITLDDNAVTNAAALDALIDGTGGGGIFLSSGATGTDVDTTAGALSSGGPASLTRNDVRATYTTATNTLNIFLNSEAAIVTGAALISAVETLALFNTDSNSTAVSGPSNITVANVTPSATYGTLNRTGAFASYAANTLTISLDSNDSSIGYADVIAAIDATTEFTGTTSTATSGSIDGTAALGATHSNVLDRIAGVVATFDAPSNVLTLRFDGSDTAITNTEVITAINNVTEFENTASTGTGTIDGSAIVPSANFSTAARVQDLVVRIGGELGSEVFSFQAGTTFQQIADAVQLVSDSTGVTATVTGSTLQLDSANYGTNAAVEVEVLSEGAGGVFKSNLSALRTTGTNVTARVNGVQANADGNTLSINTSTLDLSLTVDNGSSTDINFTINGGGAVFQLGPDVVSNQQAQIGVQSIATGRLGGVTGRLYELRSGGARALRNDTTGAQRIVDESIVEVVNLRGRLGAFQRTTLESNIASLQDTLVNLTKAESSIRDADFAKESAALTRAQILVQSGTSVLAIANQNPQNVLALLG